LPNGSALAVHDIYDPLPAFMQRADVLFCDLPYNQSLLTNFSNREAARVSAQNPVKFHDFLDRVGACVNQISPKHCFIEIGKEALADVIHLLRRSYQYVTFYNSTYYRRSENKCYIVHATNVYKERRYKALEDMDEADAVAWICANVEFQCIGDLCMGEGLVGRHAYLNSRSFVGIDINEERLRKLVEFIESEEK
jgi:hypothetical protein